MIYLLDTNVWIHFLNHGDGAVKRRMTTVDPEHIHLCSVVKAELYYGAEKSERRHDNLRTLARLFDGLRSLAFDDSAARLYGRLRAGLTVTGTPIGPNDLMIAAIALANDAVLVTHNVREFARVEGLRIEDWETDEQCQCVANS